MKTYTGLRNLFGTLVGDTSTSTLTLADELMNDSYREIVSMRPWSFMETQSTALTVAAQAEYQLPYNLDKLTEMSVTVGSTLYVPEEAQSQEEWDCINQNTEVSSDYPEYFWVQGKSVSLYPKPASAGNTITYTYRQRVVDLSEADYSTGTVDAVTNGSAAVVGLGTSWLNVDAGFVLKVTPDITSPAMDGDGFWYEISSITDNNNIVLTREYEGTSLATPAGAAYTIGEVSILPEAYQDLPVYSASMKYYATIFPEPDRYGMMQDIYARKLAQLVNDHGYRTTDVVVRDGLEDRVITNPNLFVSY